MRSYVHAVLSSSLGWAGNIYDLVIITYAYTFLHSHLDIPYAYLTVLFALGLAGRAIGAFYFGKLADIKGRKTVAMIGTAGYSLSQLAFSFTFFLPAMLLLRAIEGIFMGAQWTSGTVLAVESAPPKKLQLVNSVVQAGYAMGYAMTGVVYALVGQISSFQQYEMFMITGAIPLMIVPYIALMVQERFVPTNNMFMKVNVKDYYGYLIKASLAMSGMFIAYMAVFSIYPDYASLNGFSSFELGTVMAIANGIQAFSYVLFARLTSFASTSRLIYFGLIGIIIAAFLSMPLLPSIKAIPVMSSGIILYAFSIGFWPLISSLVVSSVPPEVRAFITGTSYNLGAVWGGVVSALLGVFIQAFGMSTLPFFIDGLEGIAVSVVFISIFTWPKRTPVPVST
ncbi:MFS transporter [Sulfuracidifex tepidarius]|uniref:Sialic acid transporter n=3 Tax=Sulfuracidifex tepidarius TaxID=1294262 RepID=A0A510DZL1_9CREN|nr:MFS transporter [Sulfuracidifex tepidarius]BBG22913.1 Putative sialic acid transporter [Sulfuracidifex tepidarius]BBG25673.1 Putative sialic acid transporter [Sulfuracidifex tepidarius]